MVMCFHFYAYTMEPSAMEEIIARHPLVVAAVNDDHSQISQELEKLKQGFGSAIYNLLPCKNMEVASALQKTECLTFEKITYAALATAIKNKKAQAALKLLYCGPVCLHNNPDFLLHAAAQGAWGYHYFASPKRLLELMIEHGGLPHQKHPDTGKTPLEIAQETGAGLEVCHFLKEAAKKYEDYVKNFKPYSREVCIPPYHSIVSYESPKTPDDARRIEHYKQHSRVDYKPT